MQDWNYPNTAQVALQKALLQLIWRASLYQIKFKMQAYIL